MRTTHSHAPTSDAFDGFLSSLRLQRQLHDQKALARHQARLEFLKIYDGTKESLERAGFGTEGTPIGDPFHDRLLVSNDVWAAWICQAGKDFLVYPGVAALRAHPITVRGDGELVGAKLFEMVLDGADVAQVTTALERGREELGSAQPAPGHPPRRAADTEIGIWNTFRGIYKTYCRATWSRPSVEPAKRAVDATAGVSPPETARSVPPSLPAMRKPTQPKLRTTWEALDGTCFSAKALAAHLTKQGDLCSADAARGRILRLNQLGFEVIRESGSGYIRPDAPPRPRHVS